MAVKLKKAGLSNFVIFEASDGPGGTWWLNTYPGCEVDVPSDMYSFSFSSYPWSRNYARQPELAAYIQKIIAEYDLEEHIRFDSRVTAIHWSDSSHQYEVTTDAGISSTFEVVVSAVGFLSDPNLPTWPNLTEFEGACFHTSRWNDSVDLTGKTVAVVGTGSTASQVVPSIAPIVKQLYLFQREPGWVVPKNDRDYGVEEIPKLARPLRRQIRRMKLFASTEWGHIGKELYRPGGRRSRRAQEISLSMIDAVFRDRPDLKELVTPKYAFSGKRRIVTSDFYPALLRENVELIPFAIEGVTRRGVIDSRSVERDVDVIIMATGFKGAQFLSSVQEVTGRNGAELHHVWREGAFAFLGMSVPGFPNFYMMYGPNTNGGSAYTYMHERQAEFVVANIKRMVRKNLTAIDVKPTYVRLYNSWLQRRLANTAWAVSKNYFKSPNGTIVTQWPEGGLFYWFLLKALRRPSSRTLRLPISARPRHVSSIAPKNPIG
jgi:cation diffusion facilitator CzcD-associated flavoprotein CzcO